MEGHQASGFLVRLGPPVQILLFQKCVSCAVIELRAALARQQSKTCQKEIRARSRIPLARGVDQGRRCTKDRRAHGKAPRRRVRSFPGRPAFSASLAETKVYRGKPLAAFGHSSQSALAAASTAPAWPGTFTLFHTAAILLSLPMRNVVRSTPRYLRPYILFSAQTP